MKRTIAFRVDSGRVIGTGHVMRCLTLAGILREKGVDSLFVCRQAESGLNDPIVKAGFELVHLHPTPTSSNNGAAKLMHGDFLPCSQEEDAYATLEALKASPDIGKIIVDHYGIYRPWDEIVRHRYGIYKIDDLADREHLCHGILDQNFYRAMELRYQGLVPQDAIQLYGPSYALVRVQFRGLDISNRSYRDDLRRILVSFGGADSGGHALRVAGDLLAHTDFQITVMGLPHHSQEREWSRLQATFGPRLTGPAYLSDPIRALMDADIYIGAGGTITWERFACGLPGVVYSIAQNQVEMSEDLHKAGLQVYAGDIAGYSWDRLRPHLDELASPGTRWGLAMALRELVDGCGAERVVAAWGLAT